MRLKVLVLASVLLVLGFILAKAAKSFVRRKVSRTAWHDELKDLCTKGVFWIIFISSAVIALLMTASEVLGINITLLKTYTTALAAVILKTAAVLILGNYVIKILIKITTQLLKISKIDDTLHPFLISSGKIFMYILLGMISLETLGIPTASLIAALASAGLAVSLSIKDHLSNLIGGVVILFSHPFRVNDLVEINGTEGVVSEIGLIYTVLKTFDNRTVLIPNNDTAKAKIVNHSAENIRRVDLVFSIGYNDDYEKARELIFKAAKETGLCLPSPAPFARMKEHNSSSIDISCRLWTNWENYFELGNQMRERVKILFDENSINIPYNQMDIHIIDSKAN